jgi:hypothetical protein
LIALVTPFARANGVFVLAYPSASPWRDLTSDHSGLGISGRTAASTIFFPDPGALGVALAHGVRWQSEAASGDTALTGSCVEQEIAEVAEMQ